MKSITELLEEKNQYLEKFFRINEEELEKFVCGEFENLERFYASREGLLALIKKVDEIIERSGEGPVDPSTVSPQFKKQILDSLQYKNDLVNRILEQDLRILSAIEKEKSSIIKELTQVRAAKKVIGSYKTGGVKKRLDEEA
jgi:hypothetical protein